MNSKNTYSSSSSSLRAPESGGQVQKQWLLCSPSVFLYLPPFSWTHCLQGPSPSGVTAKRESNTSGCRGVKENFFYLQQPFGLPGLPRTEKGSYSLSPRHGPKDPQPWFYHQCQIEGTCGEHIPPTSSLQYPHDHSHGKQFLSLTLTLLS